MREPTASTPMAATARALMAVLDALGGPNATPRIGRRHAPDRVLDGRDQAGYTLATLAHGLQALEAIDEDEDLLSVPPPPCRSRWSRIDGSRSPRCRS